VLVDRCIAVVHESFIEQLLNLEAQFVSPPGHALLQAIQKYMQYYVH
jgi:hypothetical protein